ncbi:Cupin domain-containing protein [Humitalea rosea]|uniref:Cupin domain-containing protein n=1 Tax=Humitalea rosea TaxID=990373 RepID=A0A2W7IRC6_9PROT|nr:cupin domain-containing protein [Humitalea rosea]PZW48021.1 Cupin domain-containing protein [Humitalea rosea]
MPDAPLVIVQPDDAVSFWQPVPANGFVRCLLASKEIGAETPFSMGTQTVDPDCFVREHVHPDNEEVIFILEGHGEALLDGKDKHPLNKGTCLFIGRNRPHRFQASGDGQMTFMWLMMPGGLETFFARIGRARKPGDPAPAPFPRPADVLQIEAETVFGTLPPKA